MKRVAHGGKRLAVCVVASFAEKSPGQGRTLFEQVVEHAAQVLGVGGSRSSSAARSQAWRTSQEQLTVSTVPVLAFNGAADPVEQPRNWAGARKVFPDSREYALPGQGHDVNSDSWMACARPLTQTFIEQASAARLDTSCLASVPAPPFEPTLP